MNKSEYIKELIEEGRSLEDIVELSEAKEVYVKSQFTKNGKDWRQSTEPVEEETEPAVEEIETVEEADSVPEGSGVDLEPIVEPVVPNKKVLKELAKEIHKDLVKATVALPVVRRVKTNLYVTLLEQVLKDLDMDFRDLGKLRARYKLIKPVPAPTNVNAAFREIQIKVLKLFNLSKQK